MRTDKMGADGVTEHHFEALPATMFGGYGRQSVKLQDERPDSLGPRGMAATNNLLGAEIRSGFRHPG